MSGRASVDVRAPAGGGPVLVRVRGPLDERSRLAATCRDLADRAVVADVSRVTAVSDAGVREWLEWVRGLEESGVRLVLWRCPPPVAARLVGVPGFAGGGLVHSLVGPLTCPTCGARRPCTVTRGLDPPAGPPCERCGAATALDADVRGALEALRDADAFGDDPEMEALVELVLPDAAARMRSLDPVPAVARTRRITGPDGPAGEPSVPAMSAQVAAPQAPAPPPGPPSVPAWLAGVPPAVVTAVVAAAVVGAFLLILLTVEATRG